MAGSDDGMHYVYAAPAPRLDESEDPHVEIDEPTYKIEAMLDAHKSMSTCLVVNTLGTRIISGGKDGRLVLCEKSLIGEWKVKICRLV